MIAMNEADLKVYLTQDAPPAQDFAFTLAVMARIEKRQFRQDMLRNIGIGVTGALLLALLMPSLTQVWGHIAMPLNNNWVIGALLLAGAVVALPQLVQRN
jgi:hypothetical protein